MKQVQVPVVTRRYRQDVLLMLEPAESHLLKRSIAPSLGLLARRRFFNDIETADAWNSVGKEDSGEEAIEHVHVRVKQNELEVIGQRAIASSEQMRLEAQAQQEKKGYRSLGDVYAFARADQLEELGSMLNGTASTQATVMDTPKTK